MQLLNIPLPMRKVVSLSFIIYTYVTICVCVLCVVGEGNVFKCMFNNY